MTSMRTLINLVEGTLLREAVVKAVHRTSPRAADAIRQHGFSLETFGKGAGAGSGEPAGVFVSIGDGEDFSRENDKRNLGLSEVLPVRVRATNVLHWERDDRLAFFREARMEFVRTRFNLTETDADSVIRYKTRILKERPELEKIADWLDGRDGERELALFLNRKLQHLGYDAVQYRDPWQGVEQMIVLDPSKIEVAGR